MVELAEHTALENAQRYGRPSVAVVQDGTRRRYIVPLAFAKAGLLDRVYSDWFVRPGSFEARLARCVSWFKPQLGRRMGERSAAGLDPEKVISNWFFALRLQAKLRKIRVEHESYMHGSHETARWILREGFGEANILYGFIRNAAPELFRQARRRGLRTIGDQIIAPYQVEVNELIEQHRRWPGWSKTEVPLLHQGYLKFEQETWEQLDKIVCMSDYVRQGLLSCGVSDDRITVIPQAWDHPNVTPPRPVKSDGRTSPLTVGFAGAVGLRKGAPWFLEVARRFDPRQVRFVMVGNLLLNPEHLGPYQHVEITGWLPRSQVREWMSQFDIFFFPSTCEGSAGAVVEAMASGIPVLTTPNSGSRARHGMDGFVYRYDQIDEFESAIRQLDANRDLLHQMGESARQHILNYDLDAYGADLKNLCETLRNSVVNHPD
jgi:glycosyltransferase involved in cell wall biosynthesis